MRSGGYKLYIPLASTLVMMTFSTSSIANQFAPTGYTVETPSAASGAPASQASPPSPVPTNVPVSQGYQQPAPPQMHPAQMPQQYGATYGYQQPPHLPPQHRQPNRNSGMNNMPWNNSGMNNMPWNSSGSNNMPWNNSGVTIPIIGGNFVPWSSDVWNWQNRNRNFGNFGPFEQGPMDWVTPNPKDGLETMWDDMIKAPHNMGTMPGNWQAPSVSIPNPVDLGDQIGTATKDVMIDAPGVVQEWVPTLTNE